MFAFCNVRFIYISIAEFGHTKYCMYWRRPIVLV